MKEVELGVMGDADFIAALCSEYRLCLSLMIFWGLVIDKCSLHLLHSSGPKHLKALLLNL